MSNIIQPDKEEAILLSSAHVAAISELLQKYGITFFEFQRIYPDGKAIYLNSNRNWAEYFLDIFCEEGLYNEEGELEGEFHLWKLLPDSHLTTIAREAFNIDNGCIISKRNPKYKEHFYFGSTKENAEINQFYINHRDVLEDFIKHFKIHAAPTLAHKERLFIPVANWNKNHKDNLIYLSKNQKFVTSQQGKQPVLEAQENTEKSSSNVYAFTKD